MAKINSAPSSSMLKINMAPTGVLIKNNLTSKWLILLVAISLQQLINNASQQRKAEAVLAKNKEVGNTVVSM